MHVKFYVCKLNMEYVYERLCMYITCDIYVSNIIDAYEILCMYVKFHVIDVYEMLYMYV